jgi:hypothetical protein
VIAIRIGDIITIGIQTEMKIAHIMVDHSTISIETEIVTIGIVTVYLEIATEIGSEIEIEIVQTEMVIRSGNVHILDRLLTRAIATKTYQIKDIPLMQVLLVLPAVRDGNGRQLV